jgi:uracil phosphoribosyltransferase
MNECYQMRHTIVDLTSHGRVKCDTTTVAAAGCSAAAAICSAIAAICVTYIQKYRNKQRHVDKQRCRQTNKDMSNKQRSLLLLQPAAAATCCCCVSAALLLPSEL